MNRFLNSNRFSPAQCFILLESFSIAATNLQTVKTVVNEKVVDSLLTIAHLLLPASIACAVAVGATGKVATALFGFGGSQSIGGIMAGVL